MCAGPASPSAPEPPRGSLELRTRRLRDHSALLLCSFGSALECCSLFGFLFCFLQAKLGIGQIHVGLHPTNLAAQACHYKTGSPVGWSLGLDTKPSLFLLGGCSCMTYVPASTVNFPAHGPREVPLGLVRSRACWELGEQRAAFPAVLLTLLFKMRDDNDNYKNPIATCLLRGLSKGPLNHSESCCKCSVLGVTRKP